MHTTISKDGTHIAYYEVGTGPTLLVVGGALADHESYASLANALAPHCTVVTFDRRGRGLSGDAAQYTPDREVDDVAAVLARCKGPASLYGHSSGAALAMRVAASGVTLAKLILADPPYSPHGPNESASRAEHAEQSKHIQQLVARGALRESAQYFLSGFGLSEDELDGMLQSPSGNQMITLARTLPYDFAMLGDGVVPIALASAVTTPTLVLAPGETLESARQLANAMPNARFTAMAAPTHDLSPSDIAPVVRHFLAE